MTEYNADEHLKRFAEELAKTGRPSDIDIIRQQTDRHKEIVFGLNELTSNTNIIVVGVWLTFLGVLVHVIHHW